MDNLIKKVIHEKRKELIYISIIRLIVTIFGVIIPIKVSELITNIDRIDSYKIIKYSIAFLIYIFINCLSSYFLIMSGKKIAMKLRNDVWNNILEWKIKNFDHFLAGEVSNRILDNIENISDFISSVLPDFIESTLMLLLMIIVLFHIDLWLTLTYLISSLVIIFVMLPISGKTQTIIEDSQQSAAELSAIYVEATRNIRFVKAYTTEEKELEKANNKMENWMKNTQRMQLYHSCFSSILSASTTISIFLICGIGAYRFRIGAISIGVLTLFAFYIVDSLQPLEIVGNFSLEYNELKASIKMLNKMVTQKTEIISENIDVDIPSADILKFQNVTFGYTNNIILNNITFNVKKGEKLILVGENGSGKTTILSLIERFYDTTTGKILWGNTSINNFPVKKWRSKIGYAFQNYIISTGTIRENLQYGIKKEIDSETMREALIKVGLWNYVKSLSLGLDSSVGESGNNLSGGQKQRLALARLYIRDTDIILFDEATSQLDPDSQKEIEMLFNNIIKNKICITIAHKLSTINSADKIAVIKNGHIINYGKHSDLIKKCDYYQTLLKSGLYVGGNE